MNSEALADIGVRCLREARFEMTIRTIIALATVIALVGCAGSYVRAIDIDSQTVVVVALGGLDKNPSLVPDDESMADARRACLSFGDDHEPRLLRTERGSTEVRSFVRYHFRCVAQ